MNRRLIRYLLILLLLLVAGAIAVGLFVIAGKGSRSVTAIPSTPGVDAVESRRSPATESKQGGRGNDDAFPGSDRSGTDPLSSRESESDDLRSEPQEAPATPTDQQTQPRISPRQTTRSQQRAPEPPAPHSELQAVRLVREREQLIRAMVGSETVQAEDPEFGTPLVMLERVGGEWRPRATHGSDGATSAVKFAQILLQYLDNPSETTQALAQEEVVENDWVFVETVLEDAVGAVGEPLGFARLFAIRPASGTEDEEQYLVKVRSGDRWLLIDVYVYRGMVRDLIFSQQSAADIIQVSP